MKKQNTQRLRMILPATTAIVIMCAASTAAFAQKNSKAKPKTQTASAAAAPTEEIVEKVLKSSRDKSGAIKTI